jgi:ribosomal protein S18 acetylase RimI-like enzyme
MVMGADALLALNGSVSIEQANWRDLNALRQVERVCFPMDAWPIWDLLGVLTLPNVVRLKAVADERMVGFIAGDIRPREDLAWIATIGVVPEYRRRGIGAALLQACEAQLTVRRLRLSVRASNREAIELYERFNYQRVGRWDHYYQDGEDAVVMEKTLDPGGKPGMAETGL